MSKIKKQLIRLQSNPKDFTFEELEALLIGIGFILSNAGGTSGSAVRFKHPETGQIIRLHRPHPLPILKQYLIKYIVNSLKQGGYLDE